MAQNSANNTTKHQQNGDTENPEHNQHGNHNKSVDADGGQMEQTQMDHSEHDGTQHEGHENHHEKMVADFRQRFFITTLISIPIIFLSPIIQDFFGYSLSFGGMEYVLLILSTVVYLYGGVPFFKGFWDELESREPGMMTLVALAITVSYLYSALVVLVLSAGKFFFWELATLIIIMLLGHWIEMRSVMGASRALEELAKLIPSEAHLVQNNDDIVDVKTSELGKGDLILIKPGEKVPADGKIEKGQTSLNEAAITGESKPVSKGPDDEVIGGSVNGDGSIRVRIEKTGKDSYLNQVMDLVKEAQETRSRTQDLANRAAFYLTIIAIVGGVSTFAIWMALDAEFTFALERAVTVMVITCPHALGLAVPLVVAVSTSLSAKNGVLIRDRASFERVRNIDKIVFDKTGTLTKGEFRVTDIVKFTDIDDDTVLKISSSLESESEHSIAQGIVKSAEEKDIDIQSPDKFEAIPGKGIRGKVGGEEYMVVSPVYLQDNDIDFSEEKIDPLHNEGKTVVFLIQDNKALGALALADVIRDESKSAIKNLQERGITAVMLTGDNKKVAKYVADEIGIDEYYAEVLPDQKSDVIKKLQTDNKIVAMVGDGINDAPALATADVGIAIGAGTDVAIESADIILVKDNPENILDAINLSQNTYSKMQQNLAWATGYNALAIPLAAGILFNLGIVLSPAVGAALMSLSTVIVAINSRFLKL